MKTAKIGLWRNPSAETNPQAPVLTGLIELPAELVWELWKELEANQGLETNPSTGQPIFKLRPRLWKRDEANNGPVVSGEIETPAEHRAYLASKAAPAAANGNGAAYPWVQQAAAAAPPQPQQEPAYVPSAQQPPLPAGFPMPAAAPQPAHSNVLSPAPWQAPELPQQQIAPKQAAAAPAPGGWQDF
jgi:hypothetical protein